ncbi:unnamed protein product [Onchocerca flexuosa]|uniref:Ovule protein n=1 Tax=Onchocerca flexuosa TaxID=387005 RepID=A0A183HJV6_9BILA|nr:unnamed protein product [Onchocerca flexuosa]
MIRIFDVVEKEGRKEELLCVVSALTAIVRLSGCKYHANNASSGCSSFKQLSGLVMQIMQSSGRPPFKQYPVV